MTGADFRHKATAGVHRSSFGRLPDGRVVEAITLVNARGMSATVLTYGASLQALLVPGRDGTFADVVLGHSTLAPYLLQPQYLGATVGRVANRIAAGRFHLDGLAYQIPPNNGPNALHGGPQGFDKANWSISETGPASVTLAHMSPNGDQGFPGTLRATATYRLAETNDLHIDYRAETDQPTLVNMTSHAYWNLAGEGGGTAMDHRLQILAAHYLPTDATAIPTGEVRAVEGTAFDFRHPRQIGTRVRNASDQQILVGHGYDHNWVLSPTPGAGCRWVAQLEDPASGRTMALFSDQPGLQFYSGNFLDGTSVGKSGRLYRMGDAVALEPQMFPDTPNRPAFGSIRLAPGKTYRNSMILRFGINDAA